jgi:hypothetical protein
MTGAVFREYITKKLQSRLQLYYLFEKYGISYNQRLNAGLRYNLIMS